MPKIHCIHCEKSFSISVTLNYFICGRCGWGNILQFEHLTKTPILTTPATLMDHPSKYLGQHVGIVPFTQNQLEHLRPEEKKKFLQIFHSSTPLTDLERLHISAVSHGLPLLKDTGLPSVSTEGIVLEQFRLYTAVGGVELVIPKAVVKSLLYLQLGHKYSLLFYNAQKALILPKFFSGKLMDYKSRFSIRFTKECNLDLIEYVALFPMNSES